VGFWHCIGDAPVGVPPEEGDYWEPDPGPEDGCARLGSVGTGGGILVAEERLGSRFSIGSGPSPGVYQLCPGGPKPLVLIDADAVVPLYLVYHPATLEVTEAWLCGYPSTGVPRKLEVMDEDLNVLLDSQEVVPAGFEWVQAPLNGQLFLDRDATYWLCHRTMTEPGLVDVIPTGPPELPDYSAWLSTEHYEYCDLVAYPVPDTSRHVLPLLKRATLGEGTLIPGGASLCR